MEESDAVLPWSLFDLKYLMFYRPVPLAAGRLKPKNQKEK